jgi:hypothetical protein
MTRWDAKMHEPRSSLAPAYTVAAILIGLVTLGLFPRDCLTRTGAPGPDLNTCETLVGWTWSYDPTRVLWTLLLIDGLVILILGGYALLSRRKHK